MLDEEGANIFLQQCFDLWINPEIERRRQSGLISEPPNVFAAEVIIFGDGRPLVVRINTEVQSSIEVQVPKERVSGLKPGDLVSTIGSKIVRIHPPPEEINNAHVILMRTNDAWAISFDFTYNSGHVAECYKSALEFFDAASDSFLKKRYRAFVDNLFSSIELLSQCFLLMGPGSLKHSHYSIHQNINLRKRHNSAGGDIAPLLNRLSAERDKARYRTLSYAPKQDEMKNWRDQAATALDYCKSQIPARARGAI
jgi:hypothetical protein